MATPDVLNDFPEYLKLLNLQFSEYRQWGTNVHAWTDADKLNAQPLYLSLRLPARGRPRKFGVEDWVPRAYRVTAGARLNIDGPPLNLNRTDRAYRRAVQAQNRLHGFQRWFGGKSVEQNLSDCHRHTTYTRGTNCRTTEI